MDMFIDPLQWFNSRLFDIIRIHYFHSEMFLSLLFYFSINWFWYYQKTSSQCVWNNFLEYIFVSSKNCSFRIKSVFYCSIWWDICFHDGKQRTSGTSVTSNKRFVFLIIWLIISWRALPCGFPWFTRTSAWFV